MSLRIYRKSHNFFSVDKKKLGTNGEEFAETIAYKSKFINSIRVMSNSLSVLLIILLKDSIKTNAKTAIVNLNMKQLKTKHHKLIVQIATKTKKKKRKNEKTLTKT